MRQCVGIRGDIVVVGKLECKDRQECRCRHHRRNGIRGMPKKAIDAVGDEDHDTYIKPRKRHNVDAEYFKKECIQIRREWPIMIDIDIPIQDASHAQFPRDIELSPEVDNN